MADIIITSKTSAMLAKEKLYDLKRLSLKFYREEVEVILKDSSLSLKGILVSRIWGERISQEGQKEDTVIALTIRKNDEDFEILCKEIETLIIA